jgi:hypothetical protein
MGGVATAAAAALVAVVGVLIARGLFNVAVLAPEGRAPGATPAPPCWPAWRRLPPCSRPA